jgi:hypothetical protein
MCGVDFCNDKDFYLEGKGGTENSWLDGLVFYVEGYWVS